MKCYLGPPIWFPPLIDPKSGAVLMFGYWGWPDGVASIIDLRSLPDQSLPGVYGDRPYAFVVAADGVDLSKTDGYTLICDGDPRDARPDAKLFDTWESITGVRPTGDSVSAMLWSHMTTAADPKGLDHCKPLMPTSRLRLELHLGPVVESEPFTYGRHPLTNIIQAVIQDDVRVAFDSEQAGQSDANHAAKVTDYLATKYGLDKSDKAAWQALVPTDIRAAIDVLVPHETSFSESFNTADSTTLGPDLSWTETTGNLEVSGNTCRAVASDGTFSEARAESDVSSVDHYSQVTLVTAVPSGSVNTDVRALARFSASARTHYGILLGAAGGSNGRQTFKRLAGTFTSLSGPTATTLSLSDTAKIECNGSTITGYWNATAEGPVTDTAITTGTRGGVATRRAAETTALDAFIVADIAAAAAAGFPFWRRRRRVNPRLYGAGRRVWHPRSRRLLSIVPLEADKAAPTKPASRKPRPTAKRPVAQRRKLHPVVLDHPPDAIPPALRPKRRRPAAEKPVAKRRARPTVTPIAEAAFESTRPTSRKRRPARLHFRDIPAIRRRRSALPFAFPGSPPLGTGLTISAVVDNGDGTATVTLTGGTAGETNRVYYAISRDSCGVVRRWALGGTRVGPGVLTITTGRGTFFLLALGDTTTGNTLRAVPVNNSDGTATVTITGSGGAAITVRYAEVGDDWNPPGLTWVDGGTRTGDGAVTINPGGGAYFVYAEATDVDASTPEFVYVSDGVESVWNNILDGVRAQLLAGSLGIAAARIKTLTQLDGDQIRKIADSTGGIVIAPGGAEQYVEGFNDADDLDYPVVIAHVAAGNLNAADRALRELWLRTRERSRKLLLSQPLPTADAEVWMCKHRTAPPIDQAAWRAMGLIAPLSLAFTSTELRGVGA